MAVDNLPRLCIGLPVYNGERFIRFTLDSIRNQTFSDFELIISDNASTDSTMRICQDYAAQDNRIRYCRNLENIGSAANFNRVFDLARGYYFKWAAADDIISPTFLEQCISVLDQDPSIVLCYSRSDRIDSSGQVDGSYDYPMRITDPNASVRFSDLILVNHFCIAVFGVMRRDVLARTPLIAKYVGSDRVLLAEMGLRGRLFELPEYLFHRRDHPQASGRMFNEYKRIKWYDPANQNPINLVNWKVGWEYLKTVTRVSLPWPEKRKCYRVAMKWFAVRRRVLIEDIKSVIVQIFPLSLGIVHLFRRVLRRKTLKGGI